LAAPPALRLVVEIAQTASIIRRKHDSGYGQGRVAMNDAQRYRINAMECLSAAERCEQPYRRPALAIAEAWLSLARHEQAMDALLAIWSTLPRASSDMIESAR
jgi:hypothetical protein